MKQLNQLELKEVNGGIWPAIIAFVTIFTLPKIINDHREEYNEWGHTLGEAAWEYNHPYDPNNY